MVGLAWGILGIAYISINVVTIQRLGSVKTVILPMVGQIITGVDIDHLGLINGHARNSSHLVIIGGVMIILGAFLVIKRNLTAKTAQIGNPYFYEFIGVLGGTLSAIQSAINGHVKIVLGSSILASFISFSTGTIVLWLVILTVGRLSNLVNGLLKNKALWTLSGGAIGTVYVLGNAFLVPIIGTGATVSIILFGMILGSLIIDQLGIMGHPQRKMTPISFLGTLIMFTGVTFIWL